MFIPAVPAVTADQMREVDRLAVEVYGIQLVQMMELAGRALAELARRLLGGTAEGRRVIVAAGKGNNGGGGLAAARMLANWGTRVALLVEKADLLAGVPALQHRAARMAGGAALEGRAAFDLVHQGGGDLIVDALIGYGLKGAPRGWTGEMITQMNRAGTDVLSLDVPSGLDATSGECILPCVRAAATLTLALPKTGLLTPAGRSAAGALYLADIGIPPVLYGEIGLTVGPIFSRESIMPIGLQRDDSPRGQ
jgi:NAD(P)H-hydrate epimerase